MGFYQKLYREIEILRSVVDDLNFDTIGGRNSTSCVRHGGGQSPET